jgi:hypothetical protein
MIKVNTISEELFRYDYTTSLFAINKDWLWVSDGTGSINMFIDNLIKLGLNPNKQAYGGLPRYAWLLESKTIVPETWELIENNLEAVVNSFEAIFTHDSELAKRHEKFVLVLSNAVPWVQDRQIHPKTKLISMISSNKESSVGHRNRLSMIQKYMDSVDFYGRGFNTFEKKEDALKDYMFSIAIENLKYDNYFTEKLTDCFACGTVPIYYGSDWVIDNMFDARGVIKLTDDFDVNSLSEELYYEMMPYIKNNFEIACSLQTSEDYVYQNYFKEKGF